MASIGDTTRPAFAYDSATDTWIPVGIGPHSHTASGVGAVATSSFAAKGDLLVGTGAGTLVAQTVGANGTVLTADSAEADGVKWAAPAGGGKVLQVVFASASASVSSSSASYADTGLSCSITPSSASSKILVLVSQNGVVKTSANAGNIVKIQLLRTSTSLIEFATSTGDTQTSLKNSVSASATYLDNPATTSAITYKTQFGNAGGNNASVIVQSDNAVSTITLMEIGA
jgi:hypothetical protein